MIVFNSLPNEASFYYPIGNTPPVCLTQDLAPEQNADILLLGCGNARHVLFTCFADKARKIDVTCCDIEPMIHARNVLLYTLLIDDTNNDKIEQIWNIYHNWKIDGNSLVLLESQTQKLLQKSNSIDEWHSSVYGASIRFCDESSLSCVRCHWLGFTSQRRSASEEAQRQTQLNAAITRAKENRHQKEGPDLTGYQSLFPTSLYQDLENMEHLDEVTKQWWNYGMVPSSNSSILKRGHLNPAFLYSPNNQHIINFGCSPIGSVPLCTAYISISQGSAFYLRNEGASATERLIDCAKSHFSQWAPAFRRSVEKGSKIRIFSGDALNFCFTLRNCLLTQSTSMNLFCNGWTSSPLILLHSDYGHKNNAAPLSFDVVDTTNLADYLGPLNLVVLASSLLKHHVSSCLYTELMCSFEYSLIDRITTLFGVDVCSMALLLGLVPPDLFTNATNTVEEAPDICDNSKSRPGSLPTVSARSRLRWRRCGGTQGSSNSPHVQVEAKELAKFLIQVYESMFKIEQISRPSFLESDEFKRFDQSKFQIQLFRLRLRSYNYASFAFLLSVLKATIISDWDECLRKIYNVVMLDNYFANDLLLNLHIFGVDSSLFTRPNPIDMNSTILASVLAKCKDVPDVLCVTSRVSRKHFSILTDPTSALPIICSFEGRDRQGQLCYHSFSSVQMAFGKWHQEDDLYPYIKEDSQISGTSDLFASVLVPTYMLISMLTQSTQFVPLVKCQLRYSRDNLYNYDSALGSDLCFSSRKITSEDVFITRFMPGMSGLPTFTSVSNQQDRSTSNVTHVRVSPDGSKINSLVKRITLESESAKTKLAMESSAVEVEFKSPLTAVVSIAGSLKFKLEFPVPVSISKHTVTVARESSYIEVESTFLDPLGEEVLSFLFPCSLMNAPCGIVLPVPWTSMRVDLDVMPSLDFEGTNWQSWMPNYVVQMLSKRECLLHFSKESDPRLDLKKQLQSIFMFYAGHEGAKFDFFCLKSKDSNKKIIILPSCVRLDLANYTIVLDSAFIPVTKAMLNDPLVSQFLAELGKMLFTDEESETVLLAWKAMMPALVERCRTWNHTSKCEYLQAGEVPLPEENNDGGSPICSCGIGMFPTDYLKNQMEKFSTLRHILNGYATRAAISPIFAIPYVENCDCWDLMNENCRNCDSSQRKDAQPGQETLLRCKKCKAAKYCSPECQRADWKNHKPYCRPV